MCRRLSLKLVKGATGNLSRLHGRLAVRSQVLTRVDIVIKTQTDLYASWTCQNVCEEPVRHQQGRCVVRGYLSRGGAETESC